MKAALLDSAWFSAVASISDAVGSLPSVITSSPNGVEIDERTLVGVSSRSLSDQSPMPMIRSVTGI